ncbi:PRC-barrel domain containing protein [Streptomyces sp. SID8379]|uniref:hypothetical protein n=1 Tax=unclassified Streptomyces TaxID=2593676 RepID=UPI000373B937|nr:MULTISPECIES: hypothetical protein [unclassified Streptomyces]MYW64356.1 PRC-barrel domain containing protein [Streptomyces sp. SID8379]
MTEDLTAPHPYGTDGAARRPLGPDLVGYTVEATDGSVGKVDAVSHEVGTEHLVIDTRDVLLSKKVLLPIAAVTAIDEEARTLSVGHDAERVKAAPRFDRDMRVTDPGYRTLIDEHYGLAGTG